MGLKLPVHRTLRMDAYLGGQRSHRGNRRRPRRVRCDHSAFSLKTILQTSPASATRKIGKACETSKGPSGRLVG
jgi:hypothetical protein